MKARFYDRHTGIMGAGIPVPKPVAAILERWEGKTGNPAEFVRELRQEMPHAAFQDNPPGETIGGYNRPAGMISMRYPPEGFPCSSWRLMKYDVEKNEETRTV